MGEKYLGGTRGSKKGATKTTNDGANKPETMDILYAQALAQELLPHVLLCFESIFNVNTARREARMKAVKAKELRRTSTHAQTPAAPISVGNPAGSRLVCLVQSLYDAQDLFDGEGLGRLEAVWAVLEKGGLLGAEALQRQAPVTYVPAPTSATPAPAIAPIAAPVAAVAAASPSVALPADPSSDSLAMSGDDDLDS